MSLLGAKIGIKILSKVAKEVMENREMKRLRKYVEEDNELDVQIKQQQKTINKQGKTIEENEKEIATMRNQIIALEVNSHPPQEYICCRKCGCKIAKIKNK